MDFRVNRWVKIVDSAAFAARVRHRVCVGNGYIYLTGGFTGSYFSYAPSSEVWRSSDGENWQLLTVAPGWSARGNHGCVFLNGKIYVFGGSTTMGVLGGGTLFSDCWSSSDGITWTLETASAGWGVRYWFGFCVHDNKIYLSGGYNSAGAGTIYSDVWSTTNGSSWSLISSNFGAQIFQHSMTSFLGDLWIYGGSDNNVSDARNEIRKSVDNGANWTYEGIAYPRFNMSALVNDTEDQLILVAGDTKTGAYRDVHLTTDGINFSSITQITPFENSQTEAAYFNKNVHTIGGRSGDTFRNDVWKEQFIVTYHDNGAPGSSAPSDPNFYDPDSIVTVLSPGSMTWYGHIFLRWNTVSDGSGTDYDPSDTFGYPEPEYEVVLWAQWEVMPLEFHIEAVGSNTFPFDTRAKAAHSLFNLFDSLSDEQIYNLEPEWTVYAYGEINEPDEWGWYEGNGASLIGENPQTTKFDMNTGELETFNLYNCSFTTTNEDAEWNYCLYDTEEVINCKFDGNDLWFQAIDVWFTGLSAKIVGNSFVNFIYAPIFFADSGIVDPSIEIICVNNSFDNPTSIISLYFYYNNSTIGKLHIYNNVAKRTIFDIELSNVTILDFIHYYNISLEGYDYTEDSAPFSPDLTEIIVDPLYLGTDPDNPLEIDSSSPAYQSGIMRSDVPTTDLKGIPFSNPPCRGAYSVYSSPPPPMIDGMITISKRDPNNFFNLIEKEFPFYGITPNEIFFGITGIQEEISQYRWEFGDGGTSTFRSPSHTYNTYGYHGVFVQVKDQGITWMYVGDTTDEKYIVLGEIEIYGDPRRGDKPLPVSFSNRVETPTGCYYTGWQWNYGDGQGMTGIQGQDHTYENYGSYDVEIDTNFDEIE